MKCSISEALRNSLKQIMMAMNWIVVKMRTMHLKWNFSELLMGTSCLRRAFLDFSGLLSLNEDVPFRVSGR